MGLEKTQTLSGVMKLVEHHCEAAIGEAEAICLMCGYSKPEMH